jgi:hypothetical protein
MAKRAPKGYSSEEAAELRRAIEDATGRRLPPITAGTFSQGRYLTGTGGDQSRVGNLKPSNWAPKEGDEDSPIYLGEDEYGAKIWADPDETPYDSSPVELTERPTQTTNSQRPRTVAAGYRPYQGSKSKPYAEQLGKMTVMFRDGTLYNYYDVSPGQWRGFKASISKGRPFLNRKNQYQGQDGEFIKLPRGLADVSNISEKVRQSIYRSAVFAQQEFATNRRHSHKMPSDYAREGTAVTDSYAETKFITRRYEGVNNKPSYTGNAGLKRANISAGRMARAKRGGKNPYQK